MAEGVDPYVIKTMHSIHWAHLSKFFTGPISKITAQRLLQYVNHRQRHVKPQTIRKELMTLKRGLKLAKRAGWDLFVPDEWPRLRAAAKSNQRGKLRTPEQLRAWLAELPEAARQEAMFAALTGIRATELKRVRPEWIRGLPDGGGLLTLPGEATKGRYERVVAVPRDAMAIVDEVRNVPTEDGTLFGPETRKNAYQRASKKLGISPGMTLRDCRHTFATTALASGADLRALMAAMGHKTLAAASLYQSTTEARATTVADLAAEALRLNPGRQSRDTKRGQRKSPARTSLRP